MLLDDPGGKVKKIIKIWLDNVASVDRRLRLLDKMQKMRKAKMSTMTMVRFHSEFQGRVIIIYANLYILFFIFHSNRWRYLSIPPYTREKTAFLKTN